MVIVFSEIVGDAGQPRVDVGAAKFLRRDVLPCRRLHKWGTPRKIVPVPFTMIVSSDIAGT